MEKNLIIQKLKKKVKDNYELAYNYYSILDSFNNLGLAKREIEFMSFIANNGNSVNVKVKRSFCKHYKTTVPTINNIISRLKKKKIFIKSKDGIVINPLICLSFSQDIYITLHFEHETTEYDNKGMAD